MIERDEMEKDLDGYVAKMFSRGVIVGLFIGLYIGWAF
jgi:hypothetical protein